MDKGSKILIVILISYYRVTSLVFIGKCFLFENKWRFVIAFGGCVSSMSEPS